MLALRDQENLAHAHQTVAASKPLNQGVKQLQPKTPGNRAPKTPFKVPLKDENDPLTYGKKTAKGAGRQNENAKLSVKDAFVTPLADARQRAPLGMKTTNAKAKGLQTPAPPAGTIKPEKTTKKASTQRVKKFSPFVEQPAPQVQVKPAQDDIPDIEYMPPKAKDLPDFPEDVTYDTTFPQFQPKNLALGLESVYGDNEIGSDGLTKRERKFQEDSLAYDRMMDEMVLKQVESIRFDEGSNDDLSNQPKVAEMPKKHIAPRRPKTSKLKYATSISTIRARDAATTLSGTERSVSRGRPAPVVKPKPRVASALFPSKKARAPINPSSMRHTAATASSRTTLGYTKGRDVSSKLHGKPKVPSKQPILSPETYMQPYGSLPLGPEISQSVLPEVGEAIPKYEEDEETQNFQLAL